MSMLQRILMIALVVSMACLVGVGQAWAQTSSLQGTVTDESGGVIPGADITVTNPETAEIRTAVSNDEGFYSVPLLKKGNYAVTCSISGFATAKTDILLDLNQIARHDFEMKVGEVSSVIEVESTTARISQEPHSVGTIIEEKQVSELPLNGRNYLQLAGLAPGILRGSQAGRGEQTSYNDGEEGGFKSGGLPMDQVAILVDGVDNASRIIQGSMITQAQTMKPAIEAIAEFKVITNNVSAEYGYKAGAQVQVSTKGGTNTFHGALYEFHRNRAVSATNFMFNRDAPTGESPPPYIRNQFGGVFGGPIIKDKTFFFFSFQGTRLVQGASSFTRSVPSALARAGDFSQENNTPGRHRRVFDPTTSGVGGERTEFAGGVIPSNRISPIAVNMLNMYPLPNSGDPNQRNNFFRVARRTNSGENYDIRIDHNLSDNHRMFGRYSYRNEDNVNRGALPFPANTSNFIRFRGHQVALNYNTTLGNRMHNEFRIGITRFPSSRANEHTEDLTTQFGFTGATAQLHADLLDPEFLVGSPTFFLDGTGYPGVGGAGVNTTKLNTFYVADNFLLDVGKHSLKFGGEYRSWSSDRLQGSAMGNMSFGRGGGSGGFTGQFPTAAAWGNSGNSVADALLGWTRRTGNGLPTGEDFTAPYWGVYFQDDWRVTSRLTINMGIRWELYMQPRPNNLDATQNLGKPIFEGFPIDDTSDVIPLFRFKEWILPTGTGDCGCIMDKKNFAPRFGIAYRLTNNTVIRTGIGHYYSENGVAQLESTRWRGGGEGGGGPAATGLGTTSNFSTTEVMLADGFPSFQLGVADLTTYTAGAVQRAPDFKPTISSTQWFLDIQHQLPGDILLTLGYNGQAQSHMPWWLRNAAAPLGPGLTSQFARRRTPSAADSNTVRRLNGISFNDNITNANYNAFTAKIEKRFSDGFSFTNSFTWSKLLDIGIGSINERGEGIVGGGQPQSPHVNNHHLNYGLSGLSRKFANATSILYELPAGPGKGRFQSGPASWILGGWQLGTILTFQSGPWMSTMLTPNIQQSGGTYRGDLVGEMNLPRGQRDSTLWWNRFAVAPSAPGTYGNIGRGMLELAGFKNFDFVLSKNFPMPFEGHRMQFRFEAFNFTNTPHLGPPDSFPGNPNSRADARLASSVRIVRADQPRIIQFALKYVF